MKSKRKFLKPDGVVTLSDDDDDDAFATKLLVLHGGSCNLKLKEESC